MRFEPYIFNRDILLAFIPLYITFHMNDFSQTYDTCKYDFADTLNVCMYKLSNIAKDWATLTFLYIDVVFFMLNA